MSEARYRAVVAALALGAGAQGCYEAQAQTQPRPQPAPTHSAVADAGAPACPASLPGPDATACARTGQSCGYGPTLCTCAARPSGPPQWSCATVFLGPLPPPELAA